MELRERIEALRPWHFDLDLNGVRTGDYSDGLPVLPDAAYSHMRRTIRRLYPEGLAGRSVLDCGCNCGAHLFAAKDEGAGYCFGFDVRERWIKQARLVAEVRDATGIDFRVMKLGEKFPDQDFDLVLFMGIFYHLPDPLHGLKIAADKAKDFIVINTAIRTDHPDGLLVANVERADIDLNGVDGPNWYPTGPESLRPYLSWLGFPHLEVSGMWREISRMEIVAGRHPFSL